MPRSTHHQPSSLGSLLREISGAQLSEAEISQVRRLVSQLKATDRSNILPAIRIVADADTGFAASTLPRVDSVAFYGADSYEQVGLRTKLKEAVKPPEDLLSLCRRSPVASVLVWDEGLSLPEIVRASSALPIVLGEDVVIPAEAIVTGWKIVPLSVCKDPETDSMGMAAAIEKISAAQPEDISVLACSPRTLALAALLHFTLTGGNMMLDQPTLTAWKDVIFISRSKQIFISNFSAHSLNERGMGGVRLAPTIELVETKS